MKTEREGIDIETEELLTSAEAADYVSRLIKTKRINSATVYRWFTRGSAGVVLDSVAVGGRCFTSKQALNRFLNATGEARRRRLSESHEKYMAAAEKTKSKQPLRSESAKQSAIKKAKSELQRSA